MKLAILSFLAIFLYGTGVYFFIVMFLCGMVRPLDGILGFLFFLDQVLTLFIASMFSSWIAEKVKWGM